jgi:GNAT superfamily N-acetyltransferase
MIRQMTLQDLGFAMEIARRFWQGSQYGRIGLPFNEGNMCGVIVKCIAGGGAFRGEKGGILAAIEPFWANPDVLLAVEYALRGAGEEEGLIAAFEQWARANGAIIAQFGVRRGAKNNAARTAANQHGFYEIEQLFVKELV